MLIDENDNAASDGQRPKTNAEIPSQSQFPELERRLAESWPVEAWRDSHVVLAVSGGADSVALLRAMVALKGRGGGAGQLFTAHLHHGLRGEEADADAAWLATLCKQMGVPLEVAKADVASLAAQQGDGWEAAARAARYDFLRQTAERLGARFVATAHTADDQVETVLQRIVRGTGLAGLAGIPKVRPLSNSVALVRPLLTVERRDIVDYLAALGQDYRTDSSNDDSRYTRNRLRHELLPLLREWFNSDVDGALIRLATQADEAQHVVESLAARIARDCVAVEFEQVHCESHRAKRVQIACGPLAGQPAIIVREVCKVAWNDARWPLQAMGFHEWQLLASMASGSSEQTTANLPENVLARRDKHLLVLESLGLP
ncbi:MAG: tRNA lysidine(34) synthetase TilS [Pirellulales bacterium]